MAKQVIFDTNVAVAGLRVSRDPANIRYSADVLARWRRGQLEGVMAPPLQAEYDEVLRRPENEVPNDSRRDLQDTIDDPSRTRHVETEPPPYPRVSRDPDDDFLFAMVRAADPDFLCSYDVDGLLDLHVYRDTVILTPGVLHGRAVVAELVEGAVRGTARARESTTA